MNGEPSLISLLIWASLTSTIIVWSIPGLFLYAKLMGEAETKSQIILAILVGGPIVWGCVLSKLTIEAAFIKLWNYFGKK